MKAIFGLRGRFSLEVTMRSFWIGITALIVVFAVIVGCSSGGSSPSTGSQMATANVSLSDPAACQAPNGQFSHVYVTITDVEASTNANAGDNDPSFVDLTPGLSSAPKQVDLLGQANNQCFLAMLGSTQELQAGNYQQIRIILAPDSQGASIASNACGNYANCVVTSDGTVHDLALSSESKTGLKIPSGQIANGGFSIGAGQTEDLDIDFNTCSSIIEEGNGTFRLKPVLHAGEVSTTSTSINGTVVDSLTGKPLTNGVAVVAAEQKDANGIDRIVMRTLTDSAGGFVFCPLPAGTYDIVAVGSATGLGGTTVVSYSAGVVIGVQPGQTTGNIPLIPNTQESLLSGLVTTQNGAGTPGGTVVDLQMSALQQVPGNGPTITVPQLPMTPGVGGVVASYNPNGAYETASGGSCAANVDCVSYALYVPSVWPNVATYQSSGSQFSQSTSTPVNYSVDALAEVPGSGGTLDCSPSEMQASTTTAGGPLTAASGNAATIAFTGCQ